VDDQGELQGSQHLLQEQEVFHDPGKVLVVSLGGDIQSHDQAEGGKEAKSAVQLPGSQRHESQADVDGEHQEIEHEHVETGVDPWRYGIGLFPAVPFQYHGGATPRVRAQCLGDIARIPHGMVVHPAQDGARLEIRPLGG